MAGRPLNDLVADRDAAAPAEAVRRNIDYPAMLADPEVKSEGAARFMFLVVTNASGKQAELAAG